MHSFIVSSAVVQARKGAFAEVAWVTFAGGYDDGTGVGVAVSVMGVGGPGAVCGAVSGTCAASMCGRRGGRVRDVLRVWGHVIIGFDR